jgi:hypothetical protein
MRHEKVLFVLGIVSVLCLIAFSCFTDTYEETSPSQAWAIDVANATEATSTLVAEFVARELSLGPEQTGKLVKDYVRERQAAANRHMEARDNADSADIRSMVRKNEKGFLRVMQNNLNPDQIDIAISILRPDGMLGGTWTGSLDGSVNTLVRGKVPKKKIEEAMPILVLYHRQFAALNAKALSSNERMDKVIELRVAIAKELASIIGVEAADFWLDLKRRKGISIRR